MNKWCKVGLVVWLLAAGIGTGTAAERSPAGREAARRPGYELEVDRALAAAKERERRRKIDARVVEVKKEWPMQREDGGGALLVSNSPEVVARDGILYQDTVNGAARLFFYHVNGIKEPKKLAVVLENHSDQSTVVMVKKYGLAGPSKDYLGVGKAVQLQYLENTNFYPLYIPARDSRLLTYKLDAMALEKDMLVGGMFDLETKLPLAVKFMMMPAKADFKKFAARARVLPPDEHRLRGTFAVRDRKLRGRVLYQPDQHGAIRVTLADNKIDPYLTGVDATDGSAVVNYGNYGVLYELHVPTRFAGKIDYYLNPRGGVYAGALLLQNHFGDEAIVATPKGRHNFGDYAKTDVELVGEFNGNQPLWITFSPPGASNLPIRLVLTPDFDSGS